jgi:hypothetical protein
LIKNLIDLVLIFSFYSLNRYSVSNDEDDDDDYNNDKTPKASPTKRKRKPVVIKVNHDLSENSDDDLNYSRRSIALKAKKRQEPASSSSISSDDSQSPKRLRRPPVPTFKRTPSKKNKKAIDESSEDDIVTDDDYSTDVEKMDDNALVKKTDRRMLNDEDLTLMTQKALEDERQRVQRIQERQSQLPASSQMSIEDVELDSNVDKPDEENEAKLVFEFDHVTGNPLISVLPELVAKMKPHQLDGTMFLWENVYESVARIKKDNTGTGCILAHHMGL